MADPDATVRRVLESADQSRPGDALYAMGKGGCRIRAGAGTEIRAVPNALSWPIADRPAPVTDKVVVAAGRLEEQKAFHRLITAYAPLAYAPEL